MAHSEAAFVLEKFGVDLSDDRAVVLALVDARFTPREIRAHFEQDEIRRCATCEAEEIGDNPECPLDAAHCEFYTVEK